MKILCASDFQIGAGRTLGRMLADHDELLGRIVDVAEHEQVDLFLFLGDAFQRRSTNRDEDEIFMRFLLGIARTSPILLLGGNHDWRGYERASTVGIFREIGVTVALEPGVHRFGMPGAEVEIACLPWASLGHLVASRNGGDRAVANEEAAAHLVTIAGGLREQCQGTAILAGHWAVTGASLPNGLPTDQLHEPVVELGELMAQGWDAIALGHVHRSQMMEPLAFYCGSPYACDWGEAGFDHGVTLLETGPGSIDARFLEIEDRPFFDLDYPDPEAAATDLDEMDRLGIGLEDGIVRARVHVTQEQARRLDVAAFKRALYAAGAHHVSAVQLEVERAERARVEGLDEELDELAALGLWLEAEGVNGDRAAALRERTERYLGLVRA